MCIASLSINTLTEEAKKNCKKISKENNFSTEQD
jgi:hypothetical protein